MLQVYEDVHELLAVDEDRRYLSGYSMGGYGSYLYGLLYPDRFAAAYPISGAMTIGLWAGVDEEGRDTTGANGGDGNLENTYRLVANARNLPYVIHHGTNDELVPVTGVQRVAAEFAQLGYEYRFYRFLGYEHFTQAALDQWTEGADYLDRHVREDNPASVTYKRVPALEHAIETLNARDADIHLATDGAYWVSNVQLRTTSTSDPSVHGLVNATSHAIPDPEVPKPEAGAASTGHEGAFVMDGLAHASICVAEALCELTTATPNELDVELTNVEQANVSAPRAQLDTTDAETTIRLVTDGAASLHVEGSWSCTEGEHELSGDASLTATAEAVTIETDGPADVTATVCG